MAVPTSSTKWLASNAWLRSATSLLPQAKPWIWWPESELIFTYGLADGPTSCWYHGSSVGINPSKPPPPMVSVLLFHCASVGSSTAPVGGGRGAGRRTPPAAPPGGARGPKPRGARRGGGGRFAGCLRRARADR